MCPDIGCLLAGLAYTSGAATASSDAAAMTQRESTRQAGGDLAMPGPYASSTQGSSPACAMPVGINGMAAVGPPPGESVCEGAGPGDVQGMPRRRGPDDEVCQETLKQQPRCDYDKCPDPTSSSHRYKISSGSQAGGQDWQQLAGQVLCQACYSHYSRHGTLTRKSIYCQPGEARCDYENCTSTSICAKAHTIRSDCQAGGRDWSAWAGKQLCSKCYKRYAFCGTLEELPGQVISSQRTRLSQEEKRCSYEGCQNPTVSRTFITISAHCAVGGRDWSSVVGRVLCQACFGRFKKHGHLKRLTVAPGARRSRHGTQHTST
jgi:hypothetical protein